ncbi:DUF2252 family protein [Rivibacter subsaxonicus]|uniref:Uncharacterized protein (DUF2252 family) n=1 Tax=Rivibacter subsaxonicus TaxID=457575 RepID=A0A4Q7VAG7_9BURK|nr:DUF2252 family protein [Rivibacter subsaxonicus]RZT92570.1 uncharacterized protein (DUF2252 family) [Rivibacter subsaxonicus]
MTTVKQHIAAYEDWLREQCEVVEDDLDKKHQRMRRSAFDFLRASFFRWAATIEGICPSLLDAPKTRCVGDIHVENFGTWRDGQARLVWGINDFDEAASMPYVLDLVRLATSARLAPRLRIDSVDAEQALLEGYWQGLEQPRPLLLDEHEPWLKPLVSGGRNAAREFWKDIDGCAQTTPPAPVRKALIRALPKEARVFGFAKQSKGSGSLGRPRFIITAEWQGGRIVREAKAVVPSAWHWAHSRKSRPSRLLDLAFGEFRAADPSLTISAGFVLRRVAPDAHKVELDDVTGRQLGADLLAAMGRDLAAVHAAHKRRGRTILDDLSSREPGWLHAATDAAESALQRDFDVLRLAGVDGA